MDEIARNRYPSLDWKFDLRGAERAFAESESWGEGEARACRSVERYVMRCALGFRKLLIQRVRTDEVIEADWPVASYPCTVPPDQRWWFEGTIDLENLHHFVRHYDLERPRRKRLRLKSIANFLIHSFVFVVWPEPEGSYEQARFFFNSDLNKDQVVYEMRVADFKVIVEEVLNDQAVYQSYDQSTGEIHLHNWVWRQRLREGLIEHRPH